MLITRTSGVSGKVNAMEIELSPEEVNNFLAMEQHTLCGFKKWVVPGKLIQDAFPSLSADEREFLMTGITPEEWNSIFGEEE